MKTTKYLFVIGVFFLSFCKKGDHLEKGTKTDVDLIQNLDSNFINLNSALLLAKQFKSPGEKNASKGNKNNSSAPTISVITTEKKIKNYFIYSEEVDNSTLKAISSTYSRRSEPLLYLINYEGGGVSIVSSDKRFGDVLATVDNGITVEQNMEAPDAFINYLAHAATSIKAIKENKLISKEKEFSKKAKSGNVKSVESECDGEFYYPWGTLNWTCMGPFDTFVTNSGPLVQTMWGQGSGYNDQLTYVCGTTKAPTGCVATAMAQAMSVYRYPTTYNWASMSNFQGSPETARLMKNLGALVKMTYKCDASGAYMSDANSAFRTLGYNTNYVTYNITSNSPTFESYGTQIRNRLTPIAALGNSPAIPASPIMAGGCRTIGQTGWWIFKSRAYNNCHAFLIDGYRNRRFTGPSPMSGYEYRYSVTNEETFHFNFGWDGSFNGWYRINFANSNGFIDPTINYLYGQDIIMDIKR